MTNLLELKEKSYYEYIRYELNHNEIEELREICYSYGCVLPLTEFFNDIGFIRDKNFNKKQAYKDLAYLVQYIQELENDSKALEILKKHMWFSFHKELGFQVFCNDTIDLGNEEEFNLLKERLEND